ncbi:hypothetical protein [Corynebacterium renale]|uniref:Uncharacterized protein n=1 Tax=Corynebacterium renale TaxID=1724 RepID=A0A2A9DNE4_9CORY|nr:hypothetical protein [Corynebacterium renale]PFG27419.1 hypothetical protein ATK06_0477 [Corynebacterium renale]SQI23422.1 Uncharacterised protein [Corynebacterium renale]
MTAPDPDTLGIRLFALAQETPPAAKRRRQCPEWKKLREATVALDYLLQQTLLADEALSLDTHLKEVDAAVFEISKALSDFRQVCLQKIARYPHLPIQEQHQAFLDMKGQPRETY